MAPFFVRIKFSLIMEKYRVSKRFAFRRTAVVTFVAANQFVHTSILFKWYYVIEERWGTNAGIYWEDYDGAAYENKIAAQIVCENLEEPNHAISAAVALTGIGLALYNQRSGR